MGKVTIDFKINNTHNNTAQLLIFIYLFITSFMATSFFLHLKEKPLVPFLAYVLSLPFSQITAPSVSLQFYSFFFLFLLISLVRQPRCEENLP